MLLTPLFRLTAARLHEARFVGNDHRLRSVAETDFRSTRATWVSTVCSLTTSSAVTSAFERPLASSLITSQESTRSRAQRGGHVLVEVALARLAEGKTMDDVRRHLASPAGQGPSPEWVTIVAGVPTVAAGETVSLTQDLEPGTHVLLCFIPAPDGKSHIAHGMVKAVEVTGDSGAAAPEADAVVELDGDLAAPALEAGERTLELRNDGEEPGSVFVVAYAPGKTEADLERWEEGGLEGPAPARFLGGAIDVPPHSSVYYTLELEAGREYTLLDDVHGVDKAFTPR